MHYTIVVLLVLKGFGGWKHYYGIYATTSGSTAKRPAG
jgi:hypothetical protein